MATLRSAWWTDGPASASVRLPRLVASRATFRAVRSAAHAPMSGKQSCPGAAAIRLRDAARQTLRGHGVMAASSRVARDQHQRREHARPDQDQQGTREAPSRTHPGGASPCPRDSGNHKSDVLGCGGGGSGLADLCNFTAGLLAELAPDCLGHSVGSDSQELASSVARCGRDRLTPAVAPISATPKWMVVSTPAGCANCGATKPSATVIGNTTMRSPRTRPP